MDKWDLMLQAELKNKTINLNEFVATWCHGFKVSAPQVISNLLSSDDKQDIINGDISSDCLRAHIKAWLSLGMPNYST